MSITSQVTSALSTATGITSVNSSLQGIVGAVTSGSLPGGSDQLIPQKERLATVRPRTAFKGMDDQHAYFKLVNYSAAKSATTSLELGIQNQLTSSAGFAPFLLTGFQFIQKERNLVLPTFGGGIVSYFFGNDAVYLTLSGILEDDIDNQWFIQFATAYSSFLRGTVLAKNYEELDLFLPSMTVRGPILDLTFSQDASRWTDIQFSCTILVRDFSYIPVLAGGTTLTPSPITPYQYVPNPTLVIGSVAGISSAAASLANSLGAAAPGAQSTLLGSGAAAPGAQSTLLGIGAAVPTNPSAMLGLANILGSYAGNALSSTSSLGSYLTTPFSAVFGFIQAFSGYVQDIASFITQAINATGIPALMGLISQAGADVASTIRSLDSLLNTSVASIAGALSGVLSIPSQLASAFYSPLAALQQLSFSVSSLVDSVISLPTDFANQTSGLFNTSFDATFPLAPAPLINANAGLLGAGAGSGNGSASLGGGAGANSSNASLGTGAGTASNLPAAL